MSDDWQVGEEPDGNVAPAAPPGGFADGTAPGPQPFDGLTPDAILDALASVGVIGDGRLLALNSYENRVYQVGVEDDAPVVVKFYRAGRWRDEQILEEHAFAAELAAEEIPVVAPRAIDGRTLHVAGGQRFAVFARRGGRPPELDDPEVREWLGRFIGRIHVVGARTPFRTRVALDVERFGVEPRDWLAASGMIPADLLAPWRAAVDQAIDAVRRAWARAGAPRILRTHGDCHPGNVLWTDDGPHFVDLDDACMAPAMQDLWMLVSGERAEMARQFSDLLVGYEDFAEFDRRELHLLEALRTLRLVHYSAWLARRWHDPAFPAAFPWFGTSRYWQDRILELREQIAATDEEPLHV